MYTPLASSLFFCLADPVFTYSFLLASSHINIDYAICQAMKYRTQDMTEVLVIYDICCQWIRNFHKRVEGSRYLSLPSSIQIIPSVGKFHLGAHIRSCFPLFSLNFIHGAGQQDGEILETLWSNLNKVSSSIRSMSKAHRHEVLDDYMRDSNWKKLVGIGEYSRHFYEYPRLDQQIHVQPRPS